MARGVALATAVVVALLAVSGAGGASAQAPKRGGIVVFGPVREPACLSPSFAACTLNTSPAHAWISENVLPGAFIVGPDFAWRPRLVTDVDFTKKPPFTLTYRIRPEARWSDGVPVTARDFVFTYQAIRRHGAPDDPHRTAIRGVRAVNAKTVRVVLRFRVGGWRSLFGAVLPRHALAGEDLSKIWAGGVDNPKTGRSIGSGPFLVESWQRGRQLTLRRNPRYWGPHRAYLDRIVIRFCRQQCNAPPMDEVLERLGKREVDFAFSRDTGIASELGRISGIRVVAAPSNGWEHLDLRVGPGGHPALRIKAVRRALAYGIDRAGIVRRLLADVDPKYPWSDNAIFLNTSRYYRPNWSEYRHRPDLARGLLERAGCRRGADGIYACAGRRLSLRFATTPGQPLRARILELVQAQLRQVGVEVITTFGGFFDLLSRGEVDAALFAWFYFPDPAGLNDVFGCGGTQNITGYCQRLVTKDLDQADRILDAGQRARVLNRADRQMAKDVPVIPLFQVPILFAFKTTIRGVDPAPFDPFWNAEDWWLAQPR